MRLHRERSIPDTILPLMTDVEQGADRFRRFRAHLILQGESLSQFARELGVQSNHVRMVLQGKRDSKRIEAAIAAWYANHGLSGDA